MSPVQWVAVAMGAVGLALLAVMVPALRSIAAELRRIGLGLKAPGRVRSQAPGDGGTGDRLMGDLRRFQGERFSVPMRAGGDRSDAAATR